MDGPEFCISGQFGIAHQLVPRCPEIVTPAEVADCPSAELIVSDGHLEEARVVFFVIFAHHVTVLGREKIYLEEEQYYEIRVFVFPLGQDTMSVV